VETEALAALANPLPAAPDAEMPPATGIAEPEMWTAARAPSMAAMPAPDSPTDGLQGARPPAETGAPPEARFAMAAMDASAINEASAADTQSQTQASADGSHAAPFAAAPASLPRSADAPAVMHLSAPVASDGWSDGLGDRIAWMLQQDIGQAHLKLNPPQLGPLEVRVQVNGDQATVAFTAHNQQARDALEGASQRLRDLLGAQGFVNVHVDINQQAFQDRPMIAQPYDDVAPAAPPAARQPTPMTSARGARALLDAYA
jgi:flagellar hook-length control protein FliK